MIGKKYLMMMMMMIIIITSFFCSQITLHHSVLVHFSKYKDILDLFVDPWENILKQTLQKSEGTNNLNISTMTNLQHQKRRLMEMKQ